MIRKFLFSFLLLIFSGVNFLQAQNMWEEFHLRHTYGNLSFIGKDVWFGTMDGAIRLDTANWSYEFFNYNAKPEMILSATVAAPIIPNVISFSKSINGDIAFFQSHRILEFDGNYLNEIPYNTISNNYQWGSFDSLGTLWQQSIGSLYFDSSGTWSGSHSQFGILAIDTNNCFIAKDGWNWGYYRICSPADIDTFSFPITPPLYLESGGMKIDFHNNQWYWKSDSMKLFMYDGNTVVTYSNISFPNSDNTYSFIPISDSSVLFMNLLSDPTGKKAFIYKSGVLSQVDTTQLNLKYSDMVTYSVSPTGRIFAVVLRNSVFDMNLYSSLDGVNWQLFDFEDIYCMSGNYSSIDSMHNLFGITSTGIGRYGANWIEQNCPINMANNFNYSFTASSNGILWVQKSLSPNLLVLYRWNPINNQVDSITNLPFSNTNYVSLLAGNDDRYWLRKFDTIYECNLNGVLQQYTFPTLFGGFGNYYNSGNDFVSVINNSIYILGFHTNQDSGRLYKFGGGIITDLCPGGNPKIRSYIISRDQQNNFWCASRTAIYKFDGSSWDSIPLPFVITISNYAAYNPVICFNDQNELFMFMCDNTNYLTSHLYKYTPPIWTEYPLGTPVTFGNNLFSKDGFLWTFNGESVLRFDQNGIPNTLGIENGNEAISYNSNSVTLFPNPSDGLVTVLSNGNKMKFISVYDLSGRLCYTQEASTNQATINIKSLAQGLYLVKIKLQNGTIELKKLVKE